MTNEEAIKLISMIDVRNGELCVHTHWGSFDDDMKEALKFAIKGLKSLEAWELVKQDIKNIPLTEQITDRFGTCYGSRGIKDPEEIQENVIDIINEHLKEVEE